MNLQCLLLLWQEETEYVNVTPTLLRFVTKFFIVFAVIAIVGILTPWMAKKVDAMREKHAARTKDLTGDDPRSKAVRSIYDLDPPKDEEAPPKPDETGDGS